MTLCGDQENVVPWFQSMDIFVLPSYANEGVPQSIMQAMACKLPVISTNAGSICDILTDKATGLIVQTKDENSLSEAIQLLINDDMLCEKLSSNGFEQAQQLFGLGIMFEKMNDIFTRTIHQNQQL